MGSSRAKVSAAVIFLCCFQFESLSQAEKLETFRVEYGSFDESFYTILDVRNATISNRALQITPDTAQEDSYMLNKSGRIFLRQSFRLWDNGDAAVNNSRVASFNSSFLMNIYPSPQKGFAAEGITFLIAPSKEPPPNSYGEYLGLTNATTDGNSRNQIVAVEFDTFKQDYDPDGNHVGLDVNGVRSKIVESLGPHGIVLAPNTTIARYYNIWVCYDGVAKVMEVYIAEQPKREGPTPPRPSSPVLRSEINLREYLNQESYFGFSASTGIKYQLNCMLRWNFTIEYFPHKKGSLWKIPVTVAVAAAVVVLILIGGAWFWWRKRKLRSESAILGALQSLPGTPREFGFKDLKRATNNFDEKNKLGQGGFGVVYKGFLADEKLQIAVKWFSRDSIKQEYDFLAELTIINRLRHKHLVKLLGWCHKYGKLLLVYEYLPNGSLDKHLFSKPERVPLSWNLRYKIVSGVASALHYLHNEYEQTVVHRDLKASNIMLDSNFNARLGDFGLARALDNERSSYAEAGGVMGTIGYIAPECFHTGKATQQSDVYAFGAVVLEVVCGKRAGAKTGAFQFLVDWVWHLHRDGQILEAVDQTLGDDYVVEEAERLLLLGLACSHPTANQRPKTSAVVQMILGSLPVPNVPPFKPSFVWSSMVPSSIDSSITESSTITTSQDSSAVYTHSLV